MNKRTNIMGLGLLGALGVLGAGCGDLQNPSERPTHLAYAPDGQIAAFASRALVILDGRLAETTARIPYGWDAQTPPAENLKEFPYTRALSADGRVAAAASPVDTDGRGKVAVFRVPGGERLMTAVLHQPESIWLAPAGDRLVIARWQPATAASASMEPILEAYRVSDGALLWRRPRPRALKLAFSADGARLYMGASEQAIGSSPIGLRAHVRAWDSESGTPIFDVEQAQEILLGLALWADGTKLIASVSLGEDKWGFALLRAADGQVERLIPQAPAFANANQIVVSPDGSLFATASLPSDRRPEGFVQVWRTDGTFLYAFEAEVWTLAFSPDGQELATLDLDRGLSVYRTSDGTRVAHRAPEAEIF